MKAQRQEARMEISLHGNAYQNELGGKFAIWSFMRFSKSFPQFPPFCTKHTEYVTSHHIISDDFVKHKREHEMHELRPIWFCFLYNGGLQMACGKKGGLL